MYRYLTLQRLILLLTAACCNRRRYGANDARRPVDKQMVEWIRVQINHYRRYFCVLC